MSAPAGYQQITSLSSAVSLTVPKIGGGDARKAIISPESQNVRWRDDGTDPTATVGYLLPVGSELEYEGPLNKLRFIETAASAKLNVIYREA